KRDLLGRRTEISNALLSGSICDLVGARIEPDDFIEICGQLRGELTIAAADIQRAVARGRAAREEPDEVRRILRSEARIGLAASIEPVLAGLRVSRHRRALPSHVAFP